MHTDARPVAASFLRDALTSAIIGGAAGALVYMAVSFVAESHPIPLASVALLVGWGLTALGWIVSQRAQRRFFVYQVKNAARQEIVDAIRNQQSVLSETYLLLRGAPSPERFLQVEGELQWDEFIARLSSIRARTNQKWITALEHYEVLFPDTALCRRQLIDREISLAKELDRFTDWLQYTDKRRRSAVAMAEPLFNDLSNQEALLQDVLVYVQNVTLGEVVHQRVALRRPADTTRPRLARHQSGALEVVDGERGGQADEGSLAIYAALRTLPHELNVASGGESPLQSLSLTKFDGWNDLPDAAKTGWARTGHEQFGRRGRGCMVVAMRRVSVDAGLTLEARYVPLTTINHVSVINHVYGRRLQRYQPERESVIILMDTDETEGLRLLEAREVAW